MNQQSYLKLHEATCKDALSFAIGRSRFDMGVLLNRLSSLMLGRCPDAAYDPAVDLIAGACYIAGCRADDSSEAFCAKGRELSVRKNKDYAKPQDHAADPYAIFKNFMRCEAMGICSVEAGILVRLSDKVSRVENLQSSSTGPAVVDEKIEDTCLDIINYVCLLLAYMQTKEEQTHVTQ